MTSGCRAIACARSIVSSGVTHTGHPGPCASAISSGSSRSSPYLTIECVCPPQTSISTHGRVTLRRMSSRILRASPLSRYSSRCFIELPHFLEKPQRPCRLLRIDPADRKPGMHQHVVSDRRLGQVGETRLPRHSAEIYFGHADAVRVVEFEDPAWNREAHERRLIVTPSAAVGERALAAFSPLTAPAVPLSPKIGISDSLYLNIAA